MGIKYPEEVGHLEREDKSQPFEFLTWSKIVEQDGWIAGKPEPDRGADLLARNESNAQHLSIQVKAGEKIAERSDEEFENYRYSISLQQISDFHLNPLNSCLVCWMHDSKREPVALIIPGRVIQERTLKQKLEKRPYTLTVYFNYEKMVCRFGKRENIEDDGLDSNDASTYLERNWSKVFAWRGLSESISSSEKEKRTPKRVSSAGEMRTIFRILLSGGWVANKPHPDQGCDVLGMHEGTGRFCSIQVKTARPLVKHKYAENGREVWLRKVFHYSISKSQRKKLEEDVDYRYYIFWTWDEDDDWTPIIIKASELREVCPGASKRNVNIEIKDGKFFWGLSGEESAEKWVNRWDYFDDPKSVENEGIIYEEE